MCNGYVNQSKKKVVIIRDGWFPYKTCNIVANFTEKKNQLENYLDYRLNTHIGWKPLKLFIRDKNEKADGKLLHVGKIRDPTAMEFHSNTRLYHLKCSYFEKLQFIDPTFPFSLYGKWFQWFFLDFKVLYKKRIKNFCFQQYKIYDDLFFSTLCRKKCFCISYEKKWNVQSWEKWNLVT